MHPPFCEQQPTQSTYHRMAPLLQIALPTYAYQWPPMTHPSGQLVLFPLLIVQQKVENPLQQLEGQLHPFPHHVVDVPHESSAAVAGRTR
jgi:hypothetical protein